MRMLILLLLLAAFLYGCVEHQGYSAGLEALKTGDVSECNKLKEESQIKECYLTFADGSNDSSVCLKAPSPTDCVADFASKKQKVSACDILTDYTQRYNCVARVTADSSGRSIEEMVANWRTNGASQKCLNKCWDTESSCKIDCDINHDTHPTPYEINNTVYYPVDPDYVQCNQDCKTAVITCRDDCLSGGS